MMNNSLLLYFDENIIVPVSCDICGILHETGVITYGKEDFSYIPDLKKFYTSTVGDTDFNTSFLFAESVPYAYRSRILETFKENGFNIRSYSMSPALVFADFLRAKNNIADYGFGDNILILTSVGDSLRVTSLVCDDERWQWSGTYCKIDGVGEYPLKRVIVETVVRKVDENKGFFTDKGKFEAEAAAQFQNADQWLAMYRDSSAKMLLTYKYGSIEGDSVLLDLDKEVVKTSYESTLAPAVSGINDFIKKNLCNSIRQLLYIGPAFEEKELRDKVEAVTGCSNSWPLPYNAIVSAISGFFKTDVPQDNIADLKKYEEAERKNAAAIQKWMSSAVRLSNLRDEMKHLLTPLQDAMYNELNDLGTQIGSVGEELAKSRFDDAYGKLAVLRFPKPATESLISDVRQKLAEKNEMAYTMQEVKGISGASVLVSEIEHLSDVLNDQLNKVAVGRDAISAQKELVDFYKEHYDEYLDLKRKFNSASDYSSKSELVKQMAAVTMEPLPELKLRQVRVELKGTKTKVKTGLFKKKDVAHIEMKVLDGESLPCDAVLNIANKVLINLSEDGADCKAYEIPKGESSFVVDIESPDTQIDFKQKIYYNIFVARDVLDKQAIKPDITPIREV